MSDEFVTIKEGTTAEGYYTEKRSRFFAFAHHVETEDEVKALLASYRRKYHDARHVCHAFMLGADKKLFRCSDDGEPSGSAGKPILGQIVSSGLTDVAVFVVRYYGGVNLGTGGLHTAYKTVTGEALSNAETEAKVQQTVLEFKFSYEQTGPVMRIVKDMNLRVLGQDYGNECKISLSVPLSQAEEVNNRINGILVLSGNKL